MAVEDLQREVSFLSGIDGSGGVVGTSFWTWDGSSEPARYDDYSAATKWGGSTPGTSGGLVTYAFDPASGWSGAEEHALAAGLSLWSAVADIRFRQVSDPSAASFTFERGHDGSAYELAGSFEFEAVGSRHLSGQGTGTVISIDTGVRGWDRLDSFTHAGGYGIDTLLHEEGHLLGLGHAGPYNGTVDLGSQQFGPYDSRQWTVMSYVDPDAAGAKYAGDYPLTGTDWGGQTPTTWMPLDILAAQELYGAPQSTPLDGGQVFGFHSNIDGDLHDFFDFAVNSNPVVTLWDAGRGNTLDLSGFSTPSTVDLHAGAFSSADGMVNNIAIAFGTIIDTAIGGAGDDRLTGNARANLLEGGRGQDQLVGAAGRDHLVGGAGGDHLSGWSGADTLQGGPGRDVLRGNSGADLLDGGAGIDTLIGGAGDDHFRFNAPSRAADLITRFTSGHDVIELAGRTFAALGDAGPLDAAEFHRVWHATQPDDHIVYRPGTGALLYDADGSGHDHAVHFATLPHHLALVAADFLVV